MFAGLNFHPYENPPSVVSGDDSITMSSFTPPDKSSGAHHSPIPSDKDHVHQPHTTPPASVSSGGSGRMSAEQMDNEM